ncbi:thiol:disulfide interchange protein DsbG [Pseudoalteromonas prydzensis]|uniref:thiol:disulfide interchange protein DsbG n=1 Tax=Pseudoalteromonas prydzensis TaxID=182141 RepID=UPI0024BC6649|nr:thiol:disulfide interchange protein DsbG [Pseudoalteromonas prydzensis]
MNKFAFLIFLVPFHLVAATQYDYPAPVNLLIEQGGKVVSKFDAPANMTGYVADFRGQVVTFYVTPDEQYLLTGAMLDAQGKNIGEQAVQSYVNGPKALQDWQTLESSHWVRDGSAAAKRVIYTFTDPNCPYCRKFWENARPWVESEKVQIRHILVGILKADSLGKAAAILGSDNPEGEFNKFESGITFNSLKSLATIPEELRAKLEQNHQIMSAMGARATPATFYHNQAGQLKMQMGLPPQAAMEDILGTLED